MGKAEKPVMLVGAVPGKGAEDVLSLTGPSIGDLVPGLTDGERGPRSVWVLFLALGVYESHPQLTKIRTPKGVPGMPDWVPAGYHDFQKYRVRDGVTTVAFDGLGYAGFARESYEVFKRLRRQGTIPGGVRFQVSVPFPEDATRLFTTTARDMTMLAEAYEQALAQDLDEIAAHIPADDLIIQWDINWEVIAVETGDIVAGKEPMAFRIGGDPFERYRGYLGRLSAHVPERALLGLHLCYGELHHRHFLEPGSLAVCVRFANDAVQSAGRRVDYFHMPVPRSRHDDAYMAPLAELASGGATLYAGLVHRTDGLEGSLRRLDALRRRYDGPLGIATECGLGQRPVETIPELLALHRAVADRL